MDLDRSEEVYERPTGQSHLDSGRMEIPDLGQMTVVGLSPDPGRMEIPDQDKVLNPTAKG